MTGFEMSLAGDLGAVIIGSTLGGAITGAVLVWLLRQPRSGIE